MIYPVSITTIARFIFSANLASNREELGKIQSYPNVIFTTYY